MKLRSYSPTDHRRVSGNFSDTSTLEAAMGDVKAGMMIWEAMRIPINFTLTGSDACFALGGKLSGGSWSFQRYSSIF